MVSPAKLAAASFCAPAILQNQPLAFNRQHRLNHRLNNIVPTAHQQSRHPKQSVLTQPLNTALQFSKDNPSETEDKSVAPTPKNNTELTEPGFAIPGIEIGIPLNIISGFFNALRYGKLEWRVEDALLQACLGYITYGTDRLLDALSETDEPNEKKQALYNSIKANLANVLATISASSGFAYHTLVQDEHTRPFIPLLASTFFYKNLKEQCGPAKPFYIATMWTAACVILPAVMHDKDFSILQSPQDYLPAALLMFGSTNLADTADIEEDIKNNIETLAAKLGPTNANIVSGLALLSASAMIIEKIMSQMS